MEARDLTQVVADTSDVGHLLLNHLGAVGVAVLVPLAMTVYGAALRRLGGGVPTTGAEFYVGNAGTGFAALPVAGSFVFPGLTPSAFTSLLIVSIIANLTLAVLAILLLSAVSDLTCTAMAILAVAPEASDGLVQVTVPFVPTAGEVQVHPAGAVTD